MNEPVYLGDGLYALDDGNYVKLFTDRNRDEVYLDDRVLHAFFGFIAKSRKLNIEITIDKEPDGKALT